MTYFEPYPSDAILPRLYHTIKAHKPEKNVPMRVIASSVGKPPDKISKYVIDNIQPTLNKNQHKVKKMQDHLFCKLKHGKLSQMKYKFHMMLLTFTHQYPPIKQLM